MPSNFITFSLIIQKGMQSSLPYQPQIPSITLVKRQPYDTMYGER